jgi:hypothetical protein
MAKKSGLGVRVKDLYVFYFLLSFSSPGTQNPEPGLFGSGSAGLGRKTFFSVAQASCL